MQDLTAKVNLVLDAIDSARGNSDRILVAITGAPASGKSTLSAEVLRRLRLKKIDSEVVPMDGFHLDNRILDARGLLPRKGAPETFDSHGFCHLIRRLKAGEDIIYPVFDRPRDIAIAGAGYVSADTRVVIVEGNYLMFDESPWSDLAPLWDLTIRWDVPMPELRARLIQRWLSLNHSATNALRRAESNDIPNAQRVIDHALPCNITLSGLPEK